MKKFNFSKVLYGVKLKKSEENNFLEIYCVFWKNEKKNEENKFLGIYLSIMKKKY